MLDAFLQAASFFGRLDMLGFVVIAVVIGIVIGILPGIGSLKLIEDGR